LAAIGAQAQTALPIKPGLWQTHIDREVDGKKAPDMAERMKTMTPETRAIVEAAMKERGIQPGDQGGSKACYSGEMVSRGSWAEQVPGCKFDFSSRSSTSWKWHYSCPQLATEGDSEALFSSPENYVVTSSSVTNTGGKARASRTIITAKWLASDCGDIKPAQLNPD
jgi:hypothetical protein